MSDIPTYLIFTTVIPVLLALLKTILGDEITYWLTFIYCYYNRPFDIDGNPDTHDWCMIYNPGDGSWTCCSLTFHFSIFKGKNGVFVHRYDTDWNLLMTERIPFGRWSTEVQKARLNPDNLPVGLQTKIDLQSKRDRKRRHV